MMLMDKEWRAMKQQILVVPCLLAGMFSASVWAQQGAGADQDARYHAPLNAAVESQAPVPPPAQSHELQDFAVSPTTAQRVAQNAVTFASRAAIAVAGEKRGVFTPVTPATYQPYRPGVSVPEPTTTERNCPPLGTPNVSAACIDRDAVVTLERDGTVSSKIPTH
jgi:hypothetical protein